MFYYYRPELLDLRIKVPQELQARKQWCVWKEVPDGDNKPIKKPGMGAKVNDPSTWMSFDDALYHYSHNEVYAGIFYTFWEQDPYIGIDLDHCRDKETGEILDWQPEKRKQMEARLRNWRRLPDDTEVYLPTPKEVLEHFSDTFCDVSPSNTGLKIICRGTKQFTECRLMDLEIYSVNRFFTITGRTNDKQITDQQQGIDWLAKLFSKEQALRKEPCEQTSDELSMGVCSRENMLVPENPQTILEVGQRLCPRLQELYFTPPRGDEEEDQSALDQSLANYLAWLCCGKSQLIKSLMLGSARKRDKWYTHKTYLDITINSAISRCERFFDWESWYLQQEENQTLEPNAWEEIKQHYIDVKMQTAEENRVIQLDTFKPGTVPEGDMNVAEIYVHLNHRHIKYVKEWKSWVTYKFGRWEIDNSFHANWLLQETVRRLPEFANRIAPDTKRRTEYERFCRSYQSQQKREAVMRTAREMPYITASSAEFNTRPNLFNVQNGTIDLISGKLQPHERRDMLTQKCWTPYDPSAKCPEWLKFLNSIFQSDQQLIDYIQTLCGYILWGNVNEHILPVLWGSGANGKSTFVSALYYVLGPDYAARAPESLLISRSQDVHPTQFKVLYQKRMAVCSETGDGNRLDEARVKMLTGDDVICCRGMHQDFWEFKPTHTFLLQTNYKPQINGTDYGIWRRIKLIPFNVTYKPEDQDRDLSEKLRKEATGILRWCVEGCVKWVQNGSLIDPKKVQLATKEYRIEEDVFGNFLKERCEVGADYCVTIDHFYTELQKDCPSLKKLSKNKVTRKMGDLGFSKDKGNRKYLGIALRCE
jgi:putative DNA primase/helicase